MNLNRLRRQRGYTRLPKLILLALVIGAGYLGVTFWPAAKTHYRIKNDAKRMANRAFMADSNKEALITKFLKVLHERDGLILTRAELTLDDSDPNVHHVSIRVELPYEYPFLGEKRLWKTTIEVIAERSRGF